MQPHIEPNCRVLKPAKPAAGKPIKARRETAAQRAEREIHEYEEQVQHLAEDIEDIMARQGHVMPEDLLTLGWSLPTLNELQAEALERVRTGAVRHITRAA